MSYSIPKKLDKYEIKKNEILDNILKEQDIAKLKEFIKDGGDLSFVCLADFIIENEENINEEFLKVLTDNGVRVYDNYLENFVPQFYYDVKFETIKYLIENGADINCTDSWGLQDTLLTTILGEDLTEDRQKILDYLISKNVDASIGKPLLYACEKNMSIKFLKKLINLGADVNVRDDEGNTLLMVMNKKSRYPFIYKDRKEYFKAYITLFLEYGIDINAKNNMGMTALMIAAFNSNAHDESIIEFFIENGADITIKSEMTAYDLATTEKIKKIITINMNNHANDLVKLLKNFTIPTPIKCTTHRWEASCESCKTKSFDEFIADVKAQWDNLKNELEKLSPNLYKKIETFIFSNDKNATPWCDESQINLGWSNTDGLKEHCESDGKPFDFVLTEPLHVNDETITTFGEVIKIFKEKIEVRNDSDMLKQIFINFRKQLRKANIKTKLSSSIDGVDFYTDVEKFIGSLNLIASGIIAKKKDNDIVEVSVKKPESDYIEIHIVHNNSFSNRTSKEMLEEINDGDLLGIKNSLTNLCDWSIEDSYNDEAYRVNYLKSSNLKDIEELNQKPDGFTHILRFYR